MSGIHYASYKQIIWLAEYNESAVISRMIKNDHRNLLNLFIKKWRIFDTQHYTYFCESKYGIWRFFDRAS